MEKNSKKIGFFSIFPSRGYCRREYFEVLLLFLILRYGADLGRSRLVSLYHYALLINFNTILSDKMSKAATPMRIKEQLAVNNYLNESRVLRCGTLTCKLKILLLQFHKVSSRLIPFNMISLQCVFIHILPLKRFFQRYFSRELPSERQCKRIVKNTWKLMQ